MRTTLIVLAVLCFSEVAVTDVTPIAQVGDEVPGAGTLSETGLGFVTREGVVAYWSHFNQNTTTATFSDGTVVFQTGDAAPGGGEFENAVVSGAAGATMLFSGSLTDGRKGLFTATSVVAIEGDLAPNGATYEQVRVGAVGQNNQIAFSASVNDGSGAKMAIFSPAELLAIEGAPSPDGGFYTQVHERIAVADDGTVVFRAETTMSAHGSRNIRWLWDRDLPRREDRSVSLDRYTQQQK